MRLCAALVIVAVASSSSAQVSYPSVELSISLNGVPVPAPGQATLTVEGHDISVPLNNGRFAVPQRIIQADKTEFFGFSMTLPGNHLHIDLPTYAFKSGAWKVILNDRRFPHEYQYAMPKGWKPKSTCVFSFLDVGGESTFLIGTNCRVKD
jgi:hypothetical protein